jgi:hypothetical protein
MIDDDGHRQALANTVVSSPRPPRSVVIMGATAQSQPHDSHGADNDGKYDDAQ